ncbi:MAG TPA: hypothetical protein VLQ48_11055 [Chloroflexia bacterium]|nr:hypothetical protein [Chloroflexia bacterium]
MIVANEEIRNHIDQLKLSYEGYKRQLSRPNLSDERQERLNMSVHMLEQEIGTLEKLAQFGRVETDREKIETEVRNRLDIVKLRLATDPALDGYSQEEREQTSGELKALEWALGQDKLLQDTQEWARETAFDPTRAERTLPALLDRVGREGSDADARANAAYDAGQLHIVRAIPMLIAALDDETLVAKTALGALCKFSPEELQEAGVDVQTLEMIAEARQRD